MLLLSKSFLRYLSLSSLFFCEEKTDPTETPGVPSNISKTSAKEMATCIQTCNTL